MHVCMYEVCLECAYVNVSYVYVYGTHVCMHMRAYVGRACLHAKRSYTKSYINTYIHAYIHKGIPEYAHTHTQSYIHALSMHARICICMYIHIEKRERLCVCMYVRMYTHTHTYTYQYARTDHCIGVFSVTKPILRSVCGQNEAFSFALSWNGRMPTIFWYVCI
jgi:hypothetical protein